MTSHPEKIIARKLLGGFTVLILLFISITYYFYHQTDLLSGLASTIYKHPLVVSNAALEGKNLVTQIHRRVTGIAVLDSADDIAKVSAEMDELELRVHGHLDIITQTILGEEGLHLARETRESFSDWGKLRQEVLLLAGDGRRKAEIAEKTSACADHADRLEEKMQAIAAYARNKASDFNSQADTIHAKLDRFSSIYLATAILLSIMIALVTIQRVLALERKSFQNMNLLKAILEGIDDLIHVKDAEGRWLLANTAAAESLGKKPEELIGKTNRDLLADEILMQADVTDRQVMRSGEPLSFEYKKRENGFTQTYYSKKTALLDENHEIIGVINVARDISNKARFHAMLERELRISTALSSLFEPLTGPGNTLETITDKIQEQALQLTYSEFAYVSSIDPANGDLIGHTLSKMRGDQCELNPADPPIVFKCGEGGLYRGLWGYSLNTREPFFTNSPETHQSSAGAPAGHIPIKNFISVPVIMGDELVGQIAAANKSTGYTFDDIAPLVRLGEYFALALMRNRAEDRLKKNQEELEETVRQRTAGLAVANEKLEREIAEGRLKTYALKESEHKYSTLVDNTIIGIFIVQDDRIIYANPRFARIFGYSVDELSGMDFADLIHPEDIAKFNEDIIAATHGDAETVETLQRGITRDKNPRWLDIQRTVISYNKKMAVLGNVVDVTRRKELEHLVSIQDKMTSLGRVAAGIAHELRNPLSGMNIHLTNLERLALRFDDIEPETRKNLTRIIDNLKAASGKIESVVKRVYDFSKPSRVNLVQIDVNKSINTVIDISSTTLRKSDISVIRRLEENLPPCFSNQNLFEQLLMNLLTNATQVLEGIDHERKILITSHSLDDKIIIRVADSGPGIKEHMRDKIFDPFFTSKNDGLGIGLSICYRIVQDHGGELTVGKSDELGGAEFTITLPLKPTGNIF
ncbi:MAG: PAS domain S-box protein [Proteobacteria bacterium]|nr:PAS domain S-box protein [Pseudomonadota bacterium]MBU1738879.1 PAS domain S-box protein [Pseudomonadota bacterium]